MLMPRTLCLLTTLVPLPGDFRHLKGASRNIWALPSERSFPRVDHVVLNQIVHWFVLLVLGVLWSDTV